MRIGLLGAARITPTAIVHPARKLQGVTLQAVAARDPARAKAFARRHKVRTVAADYDALLADPDVDLIYNALPVSHHAKWTIKALEAGKHVLCEKPFVMNAAEAEAVAAAAERAGKRVIEAMHSRYHPLFLTLLDWLASGQVGRVREIHGFFNAPIQHLADEIRCRVDTGGGAMMDLGCYPLHWALTVSPGPIAEIQAQAQLTPTGVDDAMSAELRFEDGVVARLETSMAERERFATELSVIGDEGEIRFINPVTPHKGGSVTLRRNGKKTKAPPDRRSTYYHQLQQVVTNLAAGDRDGHGLDGATLPSEGAAILREQRALDAVYAAAGLAHLRASVV